MLNRNPLGIGNDAGPPPGGTLVDTYQDAADTDLINQIPPTPSTRLATSGPVDTSPPGGWIYEEVRRTASVLVDYTSMHVLSATDSVDYLTPGPGLGVNQIQSFYCTTPLSSPDMYVRFTARQLGNWANYGPSLRIKPSEYETNAWCGVWATQTTVIQYGRGGFNQFGINAANGDRIEFKIVGQLMTLTNLSGTAGVGEDSAVDNAVTPDGMHVGISVFSQFHRLGWWTDVEYGVIP